MENEYYYDAMYAFESLGDYSDSEARGLEAKYLYANKLYSERNYEEAEMYFSELGTYADSVDMRELSASGIQIAAIENANIGDVITFGHYPQDNDYSNGDEELEWFVLAKENDRILLFSVYGIDVMPFDADGREVSWHDCSLRAILNSLFYNLAFSDAQRGMIAETQTEDDTVDYVFIPSYSFMESYAKDYRSAEYTDYALSQGGRADTCIYTLRTPSDGWSGPSYRSTKGVWGSGSYCMYIDTDNACYIRPALWLHILP